MFANPSHSRTPALAAAAALVLFSIPAPAAEFSVTPIRVDLNTGVLSETITVTNHATSKLRVSVKLQEWTQDAEGKDVYKDSTDLVYFPRQLEIAGDSKRLVRVGMKTPAATAERAYRLFIEEEPEAGAAARTQVSFYFRFGVPVFLKPAVPKPQVELAHAAVQAGKVSVVVRNTGNAHFRLNNVALTDGAAFSATVPGWYSLAGAQRTYVLDVPGDVCRKARTLNLSLEGEGVRIDRKIDVEPANCA
jgi:fimbrial chaperone protein